MGGWTGGWLVPNNDIGYLICNRRQYRLATPHFIPRLTSPLPRHSLYLYRYTIRVHACVYMYVCVCVCAYTNGCKQGYRCKYTFALPKSAFPSLFVLDTSNRMYLRVSFISSFMRLIIKKIYSFIFIPCLYQFDIYTPRICSLP